MKESGARRKVPKALLKQKQQFLDTLKMEQIRSAKQTIKINQERLKEEHKESDVLKSVSKSRLLKMVSGISSAVTISVCRNGTSLLS